jgi:hypothetical protein
VNAKQQSIPAFCNQLKNISQQSGEPYRSEKIRLLAHVPELKKIPAEDLLLFHETLLVMLAWPENNTLFRMTEHAMRNLISVLEARMPLEKAGK